MSIPTLLLFRDGAEVARLDGLTREQDIDDSISSASGPTDHDAC